MHYLSVKNLGRYQHYSDRTPPWVKLHRDFLTDYDLRQIPVISRWLFSCLWIIASETGNRVPFDLKYLSQRVGFPVKISHLTPLIQSKRVLASGASTLLASDATSALSSSLLNSSPDSSEKRGVEGRGNGKRPWSEEIKPTDKHLVLAKQWHLDLGFEWGKFKNYCLAHDKRYASFEAAFRNWLARAYEQKGTPHAVR